ncbi:Ig-like domain-containing protein [Paenibacillus sp. PK3_47]|uniref:Ig-like domain-containing protein n=1 Tax=Paenibacillus sp. PK3_47 TaxID=2072642 RepID=UPI00201E25F9|nr:Ig-like domain-containing protein [Paenibacillus sp. PK3_47]
MISMILTGAFPAYALPEETAPTSWENLSPLPSGNKVSAVARGGANNATLVVVGEGGVVATSGGSSAWTIRNSGVVKDLNNVIYTGSQFVAVGDKGTVLTSSEGISWINQTGNTTSTTPNLNAIAYGDGKLIAVGDSGTVLTSNDNGAAWNAAVSGVDVNLNDIVYEAGKFVAVGDGGKIINSTNGLNWLEQSSDSTDNLKGISYGGNEFVAVGDKGDIVSAPGALNSWTTKIRFMELAFNSVTYNGNKFVVVGNDGKMIHSINGTDDWSDLIPVANTTNSLLKVTYTGQEHFIVGSNGTMFATINPDGISNWAQYGSIAPSALKAITYANNTYITVGTDGLIGTSTDGRIWSKVVSGTTGDINGVAYGSSKFVAVGANGQILTSSNGTNWSPIMPPVDNTTINSVVYGANGFVGVGNSGKIVTSTDGISWTKASDSKTAKNLTAVAYGNGKYVAVGADGTIVFSLDGVKWEVKTPKEDEDDSKENSEGSKVDARWLNNLNNITYGSDKFVAVGASGTVITSPDNTKGAVYTTDSQVNLNGVASGNGVFMAAGDGGKVFSSDDLWANSHIETTGTTDKLNAIGYFAELNRFIAVGDSGVMIISQPVLNMPRVIGQSPEPSEKDIEVDADLILTFNQKVKAATGKISIHKITDSNPAESVLFEEIPVNDSRVKVIENEVTINPGKDLDKGTEYEVTVTANAFYDESQSVGNVAIENGTWKFKTVAALDTTAPTVETYSPEDEATGVATDAKLTLIFDEDVKAETGYIKVFKRTEGNPEEVETILADSEKVSVDGKTVTISPYNSFEYNTDYYVIIDGEAFQDAAGNKYAGISESTTWNFTTREAPDTTPPTVSTLSPVKGATGVATEADLVLTFSEDVQKGTGNIEIYSSAQGNVQPVIIPVTSENVTVAENVVTINPENNFAYGTSYYVHIADGAFKDASDNNYAGISNNSTWQFTTIGAPPTVGTYSPVNAATGIAKDANLVLTFSENVTKADGNIKIYSSTDSDNALMTISVNTPYVTVQNNMVTINPPIDLAYATNYYVTIEPSAFKGAGGSYFAGISDSTTWQFTTTAAPDTTAPTVIAFSPVPGAEGVAIASSLTLTFSENIVAGEGNIVIFNSATDKPVANILAKDVSIVNNVVTIHPTNVLEYGKGYYVAIESGAFKDLAGNYYAGLAGHSGETVWFFRTMSEPDRISPTVSTYSPESWATEVAPNTNLVLTFSENVMKSDGSIEIFKSTDEINPVVTIPANSDSVTIVDNVVTINPANDLEHGTSYFVRITEGAFKDPSGNSFAGISGITGWRFMTTSLPDTAAPLVTAFSPSNQAVDVPASAALSLFFNENVVAGDADFVIMNAADDAAVASIRANNTALVSITNATVTINTNGLLKQGASYYVVVQPDAVRDEAGNSFAGFADKTVWNFATVPVPVTPDPGPSNPGPSDPGPSAPGPSTPAAPAPSAPSSTTETIPANVENGAAQGSTVSSVSITRLTDASGMKKDELTFTVDQVIRAINELKTAGSNIARIIVPDTNDEVTETKLSIPAASGKQLADNQITLDIFTVNAEVKIPGSSMAGFGPDIYFNLVPLKSQQQASDAEARAKAQIQSVTGATSVTLAGRPMTIETNLQSRPVTLVLPISNASLTPAELNQLAVFIEHSDGTKELVKGEIVPFGQTGKSGIQFSVNKFSTFTVVLAQDPAVEVKAYMTGYTDGTFKPNQSITRAEIASIIARTFNQSPAISGAAYNDVTAGHWAVNAISLVSSSGIMKGYEDGSFKPNQTITRAEMATILSRLITVAGENAVSFSDITGHWAQAAVEMTARAGIITGYENGTFRPNQSLTRAEAVTIINRALGIAPLTSAAQKWTDVPAQYWAYGNIQAASVDHTAE